MWNTRYIIFSEGTAVRKTKIYREDIREIQESFGIGSQRNVGFIWQILLQQRQRTSGNHGDLNPTSSQRGEALMMMMMMVIGIGRNGVKEQRLWKKDKGRRRKIDGKTAGRSDSQRGLRGSTLGEEE